MGLPLLPEPTMRHRRFSQSFLIENSQERTRKEWFRLLQSCERQAQTFENGMPATVAFKHGDFSSTFPVWPWVWSICLEGLLFHVYCSGHAGVWSFCLDADGFLVLPGTGQGGPVCESIMSYPGQSTACRRLPSNSAAQDP